MEIKSAEPCTNYNLMKEKKFPYNSSINKNKQDDLAHSTKK